MSNNFNKVLYGGIKYEQSNEQANYVIQINNMYQELINEQSNEGLFYTREQIDKMSTDEYLKNEKAIDFQLKTIGIPSQVQANQAVQSGGMIYVQAYTRADGMEVKGYYRSLR